ncbi:glycosyltransferase [Sulfitobacter pontiacus]|uniref:glycosyltransferase n=1 Tax=Sulfitobacter pontiacus TaxID=60137 RepID=UPI000450968C|nr:glycosyltransferase [Sulfitobacter pontiacus]KAJ29104.1 glycosyl transferase family 1 [Sulfitobacter pontiacus 3SOLIMAR09]HJO52671.1 glycosyltransferase [Sulfitobacter pontiacus]
MCDNCEATKHIALFVPSLNGGGAEKVMVLLANGFADRGYDVDLVVASFQGEFTHEVSVKVRIVNLNETRTVKALLPLKRYLSKSNPDVLLSTLPHANIVSILAGALSRTSTRIVVCQQSSPSQSLFGGWKRTVLRQLCRTFYPLSDMCICSSDGIVEEMHNLLNMKTSKLKRIYNPVDEARINRLKEEDPGHPWFNDPEKPVVLAVGRLTEAKDYPNLLHAFRKLRDKRKAALIILGQGPMEAYLKKLTVQLNLVDDVDFLGFQSNPYSFMRNCDLFVLSSAWEGLPGVLIEALACGANIVSTDCKTGPREILEDGALGALVPIKNSTALARQMSKALSSQVPVQKKDMKRFNREHIETAYISELFPVTDIRF